MHSKMIKRALKGCNGVLGKGEKGEDTLGLVELNSLKASVTPLCMTIELVGS